MQRGDVPAPRPLPLPPPNAEQKLNKQLFLPGMDEFMRAMPNHIARSSLFAPVARGRKKMHDETVLVSYSNAKITYSGKQLDESQADVWMQAIYEFTKRGKFDEQIPSIAIHRAEFLRSLGRATGGKDYAWLHQAFKDLAKGTLIIETFKEGKPRSSIGKTQVFHVLGQFCYDDEAETYYLSIDQRWGALFQNQEYSLVDWEKRLQIGEGQDMAKAIQRLLAASADERQSFALDWLKKKLEYASPMRKFREAIAKAMEKLQRVEVISKWEISKSAKGNDQLTIWPA
jgi:hypothetical protein